MDDILKDAREYFQKELDSIYHFKGAQIWTPDSWKIWEHVRHIVSLTYHDNGHRSALLKDIPESKREEANELAKSIIDSILTNLRAQI